MIPVKLQLKNFLSYRQATTLDLTGFDLAILSGDNGVGKSSLLEAITWALWGKSRAQSDDDLIHQEESAMWVEFLFDHEGNRYRVVRQRERRGRGSTTLEFQLADRGSDQTALHGEFARHWKTLTGPTIRDTQQAITNTLKLTYELFVNSSYLRQGHADEFTTKIPAQRKEILADILDLALYDRLEEKAKEERRKLEEQGSILTAQLTELESRLAGREKIAKELSMVEEQRKQIGERLAEKEKILKSHDEERQRFRAIERELALTMRRFEQVKSELATHHTEQKRERLDVAAAAAVLKDRKQIVAQFRILASLRARNEELTKKFELAIKMEQALGVLAHKEQALKETIDRLRHITVCPTCLRRMSKKEALAIIRRLTDQFEREFRPQRQSLEKALAEIGYDRSTHQRVREEIQKLAEAEIAKEKLGVAEATMKKSRTILQSIARKIVMTEGELKKVTAEGQQLKQSYERLAKKRALWHAVEQEVGELRTKRSAIDTAFGGLQAALNQMYEFESQRLERIRQLREFSEKKAILDDLVLSFGKRGVQAMIIEQAVPQIEEKANELLQKITGGRMSVSLQTQREKKTGEGELMETLDIIIRDELGERPYDQYSGGEAFRINFAIRVALAKLLAMRAGVKLQFLVVDEGFGALDASGREDIVAAISGIREEFSKIVIVTHIEEFKNLFPTRVEVTKDANGSHIQVVSQ
jgi:exonuclease SbcC